MRGFFAYHAVPNNFASISAFRYHVVVAWVRTLRRRSQRSTLPWARMQVHLERYIPQGPCAAPMARSAVPRQTYSRWEPGALAAPAGICAGGGQQ